MFRNRSRSKQSFPLLQKSNRGSDIVRPNNTSLIVNDSDPETDDLPKELTSVLSESEDEETENRNTSAVMKSLTQKTQSTPVTQKSNRVKENIETSPSLLRKKPRPSQSCLKSLSRNCRSQSERKKLSYFDEVLKSCGASPLPGDSSYSMSVDQAVFSLKLNKKLKDVEEDRKQFVSSLEKEIENVGVLQKLLAHTLTAEDCAVARGPVQEPIMRMLLGVDCLQGDILEVLIQKLANIVMDGKSEDAQIVSSILRQIRFLNRVNDMNIASRLFEIIHVATVNVQREIIFFLPEIISEEETKETCSQLIDLLKFDAKLTHVIIDALTNLPLNPTVQTQVRTKILNRLEKSLTEFLPSLTQFVLNKCDPDELTEVINGLRENLPFSLLHFEMKQRERSAKGKNNSDEDSYLKLTFENLKFSVMASKNMAEVWIKIISNINSPKEFRCLDLALLIIFYSCLFGRKNQILTLIRNKIKSGVLAPVHVEHTFKILLVITVEYFPTILELASVLLKSFDQKIADFGALIYKECFARFNFYMEQTVEMVSHKLEYIAMRSNPDLADSEESEEFSWPRLQYLKQQLDAFTHTHQRPTLGRSAMENLPISEILLHVGTGSPPVINTALAILKELSETEKEGLSRHTASIMGLLIKVSDLDLSQVRVLMDVIACLVFSESSPESSGWEDELQIFIRKQLVSSKLEQCKKGIVAAVMLGKHAGRKKEEGEAGYSQINSLLELAMGSNGTSETKRAFFNDEFATMLMESELRGEFLQSWNCKIHRVVMDNLFVKNIDVECPDFPMFLQYSLDARETDKLVFPVVVFVISTNTNKPLNVPVPVIPSALRLLWCLEKNFSRVLPVFYASVIMPESIVYDNFYSLEDEQKKKILDCLFLCANYLIECVNALCTHGIIDKALLRVKQLIKVRKHIAGHIHMIPDYVPNHCQFYSPVQKIVVKKKTERKPKKGRKRKLEEDAPETLSFSIAQSQPPEASTSVEIVGHEEQSAGERDLHVYSGYFRELHRDTHKLLETDLRISGTDEECSSKKPELHTSAVLFLLEDIIYKSEQILKEPRRPFNTKTKPTATAMERTTPEQFVLASVKILPDLINKIRSFSTYCKDLLEANDGVYDAKGMYPQEAADVKLALAAGLKFIAEIVSWRGFQSSNNRTLLRDVLTILSRTGARNENSSLPSISATALEAANFVAKFSKSVLVLAGALSIVKTFQACLGYSSSKDSTALADLCHELLSRSWYTVAGAAERGPAYNQHLDFLLKTYFACVDNKLEVIRTTAKIALGEVELLTGKDSTMKTFKTINKSNFPLLYRTICEALTSAAGDELSRKKDDDERVLEVWRTIVEVLLVLVDIAKVHSSRVNLAALLKRSQAIIQLFLSKGMPTIESALRVKSVEVLCLLKSFQTVTRFLHSICCHSKITNDSIVTAHVPIIRSLCERLTLEVKAMLILNKIPMECITIAILKNRDLKGNDIASQESLDNYSDDDSEIPPEDTPDDDDGIETQESHSEVY